MNISRKNLWIIFLAGIILFVVGYFVGQGLFRLV